MQIRNTCYQIFLTAILFLSASCCGNNDEGPVPLISIRIQFFNFDKTDNLFDDNGPLTRTDLKFEYGRAGESLEEDVRLGSDGTFNLFLSKSSSLKDDPISGANGIIFINRSTGERDSLFIFTEIVTSARCNTQEIFLRAIEFNSELQDVDDRQPIELVLD